MNYINTINNMYPIHKPKQINNILDITDWNNYIYKQKINLIDEIDKSNILEKCNDNLTFNTILKSILRMNIFNISYIAFMTLKFLETSFIPSEILLNVLNIYTDEQMYNALLINTNTNTASSTSSTPNSNKQYETYNYIKTLKFIIQMLIDFIVKIEVLLHIQCLLITNFIDKINDKQTILKYKIDTFKPKIFKLFHKSNKDMCNNVKSSTLILLFFKLINKLNTSTYDTNDIMNYLQETNDTETNKTNHFLNYIKHKKEINKKTNIYLDKFILEITYYFDVDTSKDTSKNNFMYPDIYTICSKYILNTIELIFNHFENLFTILETHLLKSISINELKRKKLSYLRNVIKNLADNEFDTIKKLFYI